jgi:hypothetical protein
MLRIVLLICFSLLATPVFAQVPASANFNCVVADTVGPALDGIASGNGQVKATVSGGTLDMPAQGFKGTLGAAGSSDTSFLAEAGDAFAGAQGHMITGPNNLSMGRAAFAQNADGQAIAYFSMYGLYHVGCVGSGDVQAETPKEEPPQDTANLSNEQKDENRFNAPVEQRGKEAQLLGVVSKEAPTEGHYACTRVTYSSGETQQSKQIDSDNDHTGFDLFADGAYRLKKTDGSYEDDGGTWRHNAGNGAVFFDSGTLKVYLKWPIHVRKNVGGVDASILYITDYDYDERLDEMTLCAWSGPAQSKSPNAVIAERGAKNLAPPPPGTPVAVAGLYYEQRWVPMMGFGNLPQMYQEDYYYYRYLQANGYVWLGDPPSDGDFAKLGCDKPMVDKQGEPLCTTYDVQDGLLSSPAIRIGHDAPVKFETGDGSVSIDGTQYFFVPPQDDLKIEKFVKYFGYNGIAAREGSIDFKADGRYESTSWSGVSFTTEIPDVSRTTVVSSNPGEDLKGTYKIEGYSITFAADTGKVAKTFFGKLGDGFFMVGGQPYFEPSD